MKKHILCLSSLILFSGYILGYGVTIQNNTKYKIWVRIDKQLETKKQSFNKEAKIVDGYVSIEKGKQDSIKTDKGNRAAYWKVEDYPVVYKTQKTYSNPDYLTIESDGKNYTMYAPLRSLLSKKNEEPAIEISTGQQKPESNMTKYYTILGLKEDATEKEVTSAYRKLAMKNHPDQLGLKEGSKEHKEATEKMALINDAKDNIIAALKAKK